jgi:hypothetical protein
MAASAWLSVAADKAGANTIDHSVGEHLACECDPLHSLVPSARLFPRAGVFQIILGGQHL